MDKRNDRPLLSIITVTFNCEDCLEPTIESVVSQSFRDVEYLIIDGGSKDRTLEIATKFCGKGLDDLVSEPDSGIYDAMNKGVKRAQGQWVLFLNAGDFFVTEQVIERIFSRKIPSDTEVLYGNHILLYGDGRERLIKAGRAKDLWKGSQFCHQSAFVRRELLVENMFSLERRLAADYEFFHNAWIGGAKFHFIDDVVVKYQKGGVSDVNRVEVINEWRDIAGPKYFFWFNILLLRARAVIVVKKLFAQIGVVRWQ
ncbi:MAG: glycosyltransferase [Gammaproteobacteria bacterium]|nr:glycosyltransferase [Gammaproteobacteria bacterium]